MPADKNRIHDEHYEIDPRVLARRKQKFRSSKLLCDSPVVLYDDYLTRNKAPAKQPKPGKDKTAQRHKPKQDFSKYAKQLEHIDKVKLRKELDQYWEEIGTNITWVEKQFEEHEYIVFRPDEIRNLFRIQMDKRIQKAIYYAELEIKNHEHGFKLWLERLSRTPCMKGIEIKEIAKYYLKDMGDAIKDRLSVPSVDFHANELSSYMNMYTEMAYALVLYSEEVLSEDLRLIFVQYYIGELARMTHSMEENAVAALLLESPRAAMCYYGSFLLFLSARKVATISEKVVVTEEQIVIPVEVFSGNHELVEWEDSRGIDSPIFECLDKEKLALSREFIKSDLASVMCLSDSSVLDILSVYNFLFTNTDKSKFQNRSNKDKGYKTYCIQTYVLRLLELEKKGLTTTEEYRRLGGEYNIDTSEEWLAAMSTFNAYKEYIEGYLMGDHARPYFNDEMKLLTIRAIAQSLLRYNAIETIDANTSFLCNCLSTLYDLICLDQSGSIEPD